MLGGRRDWATAGTAAVSSLLVAALVYAQSQYSQADNEFDLAAETLSSSTMSGRGASSQDKPSSDRSAVVVPGIWNSGNTCFMNSLLQAISASPALVRHLRNVDELLEAEVIYSGGSSPSATAFSRAFWSAINDLQATATDKIRANKQEEGIISSLLHSVLGASSSRSSVVLDLSSLEKKLRLISKTFSRPHEQQDADELLTITLDVLEKESKYAWRLLAPSLKSLGLDSILHLPLSSTDGNGVDEFGRPNTSWWNQATASSSPTKSNSDSPTKSSSESPTKSNSDSPSRTSVESSSPRKSSASSMDAPNVASSTRVPLKNPMEGTLLSLIQCENCGRKSPLRSSPFCVLAVPIPSPNSSLLDCIREFVKPELVQDVECSRCSVVSGRNPKQPARKRLMIGRLPVVLCLRLQRNQFDMRAGHMYKDQSHVVIPKTLDIAEACFFSVLAKEETTSCHSHAPSSPWKTDLTSGPDVSVNAMVLALTGRIVPPLKVSTASTATGKEFTTTDQTPPRKKKSSNNFVGLANEKNTKYKLVAVVEHLGNAFGGHYVAYRLVEKDGQTFWTRCSDESVLVVPESKVLSSVQCYMCLYERIDDEK